MNGTESRRVWLDVPQPNWKIAMHEGRKQPYTVWHHQKVSKFTVSEDDARAYIARNLRVTLV